MPDLVRSPLADAHVSQGATLGEYRGALVPARFRDPVPEHHSVRKAAGLFDFSFRAKFSMKGQDRARFLQRIVSNDVKNLATGQGTYATLLTAQGHIVADFRIYCAEDSFLFDTDADLRDKTMQALGRYIIADRVTLEPLPLFALSVQGPQSRVLVEKASGGDLPVLAEYGHFSTTLAGTPVRIVQASSTGEEGYEVWVGAEGMEGVWNALSANAPGGGAAPAGTAALESLRIEAGIPRYGPDFGEDTLPLEAGLLNALSFNKGCYIGQEIVERARSRGHVNWKLVGMDIDSAQPPAAGEKLLSQGKEAGEVTSACVSPTLSKTIALGYVRREASDAGTRLVLASGAAAQIAVLPFYRSRGGFCG
jgi:glycine cleavage system T protein